MTMTTLVDITKHDYACNNNDNDNVNMTTLTMTTLDNSKLPVDVTNRDNGKRF